MRLFFAIDPESDVKVAASQIGRPGPKQARIRWLSAENLHLTIKFLGSTSPDILPRVIEVARETIAQFPAFDFELQGVGHFPHVVWIGVAEGAPAIRSLMKAMDEVMLPLGFVPEDREPFPHLTIGRVKEGRYVTDPEDLNRSIGRSRAREVILFESRTKPEGSVYEALARFPLRLSWAVVPPTSFGPSRRPAIAPLTKIMVGSAPN